MDWILFYQECLLQLGKMLMQLRSELATNGLQFTRSCTHNAPCDNWMLLGIVT